MRSDLCEAEIFLIQFYKDIGLKLTNGTLGGDGKKGPCSQEQKLKVSRKLMGHQVSKETRLIQSQKRKEYFSNPKNRQKTSELTKLGMLKSKGY